MTYREFCASRFIDPFHPYVTWTPEDHAAFATWKLENFWDKWKALAADGTVRLMSREQISRWMRDSLSALHAPVPSRRWKTCPCHSRPRQLAEDRTPVVHGLAFIRTFGRVA